MRRCRKAVQATPLRMRPRLQPFPTDCGNGEIDRRAAQRERIAEEAERGSVALKKVQFMQDKVGRTFSGFARSEPPPI